MVKGNWQRRAELASKRRDDEKERKSDRKAGIKKVTSASCAESIQSTDYLATAAVHCWFVNCDENGKSAKCCATQVRAWQGCERKKCKYVHSAGSVVSHLRGCVFDENSQDSVEDICSSSLLCDLKKGDYHQIHFISVDNRMVFDWKYPDVWNEFNKEMKCMRDTNRKCSITEEGEEENEKVGVSGEAEKAKEESDPPQVINGNGNGNDLTAGIGNAVIDIEGALDKVDKDKKMATNALFGFLEKGLGLHVFNTYVYDYLNLNELVQVKMTNTKWKKKMLTSDNVRLRLREGSNHLSAVMNKKRQDEKKKKKTGINKKSNDKKDGFARGKVARGGGT